jgi:hypothetical protein
VTFEVEAEEHVAPTKSSRAKESGYFLIGISSGTDETLISGFNFLLAIGGIDLFGLRRGCFVIVSTR